MNIQLPPYLQDRPWLVVVLVILAIPLLPLWFPVAFVLIVVFIVKKLISEQQANDAAPVLSVPATVIAKRARVSGGGDTMTSTRYYSTFQLETGERVELHVPSDEYGFLVEGDAGTLTYQRQRYKGFARNA